jgi:hypothetical protein
MVLQEILPKPMERELLNQGIEILSHMILMGEEQGRQLLIQVLEVKAWSRIIAKCFPPTIIEKLKLLQCNHLTLS